MQSTSSASLIHPLHHLSHVHSLVTLQIASLQPRHPKQVHLRQLLGVGSLGHKVHNALVSGQIVGTRFAGQSQGAVDDGFCVTLHVLAQFVLLQGLAVRSRVPESKLVSDKDAQGVGELAARRGCLVR